MQSVFRKLDGNASTINLGSILLEEGIELGEVTVKAPIREIDQVGDTTVINAAAYKTPEGSYLEALVKRIPGMEYDSETKTLKYNGLPINEINVNGEAFFAGDNKMALENLPVELISKIKVYDKKSKTGKADRRQYRKGKLCTRLADQSRIQRNPSFIWTSRIWQ